MPDMHPRVEEIWRNHQQWLEEGGENAVQVIRDMNLISFMTQGLERAEAAVQEEAYRRGHRAGYAKALADAKRGQDPANPADPAPEAQKAPERAAPAPGVMVGSDLGIPGEGA